MQKYAFSLLPPNNLALFHRKKPQGFRLAVLNIPLPKGGKGRSL